MKFDIEQSAVLNEQGLAEREADLDFLQEIFTAIGSELNLGRVFELVAERARELIHAETLLIPILDDRCETYTYRGGAGVNAEEIIGETLPIDFGVCGWVWKNKKPWWRGALVDLDEDEQARWENEAGTMILVPLQGPRHFLGGIAGINKADGNEFTRRDLNLLQMFAGIVSIAIENAMVVSRMKASNLLNEEYRSRLQALNKQLIDNSKALERLSLYDSVTGLPNRSLFHDRIKRDIDEAQSNSGELALVLIDLDRFKQVNEALGHAKGDILLRGVSERFRQNIRAGETLARLGGDEFVVVLPDHDRRSAVQRAHDMHDLLVAPFSIDATEITIGASIGVVIYPDDGKDVSELMSHADTAMYTSKAGSQPVNMYEADKDVFTKKHLSMVADLRNTLEDRKFNLNYQPKLSLQTNEVISVEVLGRWESAKYGMVSPEIFIDILEQNGMIDEYTFWAIETACAASNGWCSEDERFRIAINISPMTLMSPTFIHRLRKIVNDKIYGDRLTFEITENLFLSEYERLQEVLEQICELGITLSIDDYGVGYSSLSRLRRLPVSELKIDKSFILGMMDNKDDEAIVRSTIELAHNLGLSVVAEGVENQRVMDMLKALRCDSVQGYHVSWPLSEEGFTRYLAGHRKQS